MLTELRIENFAIIDRLELQLKPGLITFTGETGAGKSIIIDAVETVMGGRAESTMIRSGSERANIEAVFHIPAEVRDQVQAILEREDLLDEANYLTLAREIRATGRNVARVNGRSVNVSLLKELGEHLIDVHGQSEHLSLLRVREHLGLLDRYAVSEQALIAYQETYRQLIAVRGELEELRQSEHEAARRTDLLTYQINEIAAARLQPGEEEELQAERTRLANAEELASLSQEALVALDEGTPDSPAAIDLLGQVVDALQGLIKLDPSMAQQTEQMQSIFDNLTELTMALRGYIEAIEFNPKRLDRVEERLSLIHNLKRKYGENIEEVLDFAAQAQQKLETISQAGERIEALQLEEEKLLLELGNRGLALSKIRRSAAGHLEGEVIAELADLKMPEAKFRVDFQRQPNPEGVPIEGGEKIAFDVTGIERIEFMIAPNPGEGFKPLVKIASGGETSRLMLTIKNVLARADHVPTLIFDEIDQGIGGRVGTVVGQKLWRLARHHQVMCITHLPQLAAFGEQHIQVQKRIQDGRTITAVDDLNGEARLEELAYMMGELSPGTLHSARELMTSVGNLIEPEQA
ncbi:MAG TPA: DNA repair protein RecN [Anaerolineales bacterium]